MTVGAVDIKEMTLESNAVYDGKPVQRATNVIARPKLQAVPQSAISLSCNQQSFNACKVRVHNQSIVVRQTL
jgi:hypothetical protein